MLIGLLLTSGKCSLASGRLLVACCTWFDLRSLNKILISSTFSREETVYCYKTVKKNILECAVNAHKMFLEIKKNSLSCEIDWNQQPPMVLYLACELLTMQTTFITSNESTVGRFQSLIWKWNFDSSNAICFQIMKIIPK